MEKRRTRNRGCFVVANGEPNDERIDKLPLAEYMKVVGNMTDGQFKEYLSKSTVIESKEPVRAINVDFPLEEIGADADFVISELRRKYLKK